MKRLALSLAAIVMMAIAGLPASVAAQQDISVTGVGEGVFPSGTQFGGVALNGLQFENGVVIPANGSATGEFHGVLVGTGQSISLEGQARAGSVSMDGSATFEGTGTLDLGNGQILADVPFWVTATTQGLQLSIGGTTLPEASVIAGGITIAAQ